jgi:hypothetical protein
MANKEKFKNISHQENAHQNDTEIPCHPNQNDYHQENSKFWQMCGGVGEETLMTLT